MLRNVASLALDSLYWRTECLSEKSFCSRWTLVRRLNGPAESRCSAGLRSSASRETRSEFVGDCTKEVR